MSNSMLDICGSRTGDAHGTGVGTSAEAGLIAMFLRSFLVGTTIALVPLQGWCWCVHLLESDVNVNKRRAWREFLRVVRVSTA